MGRDKATLVLGRESAVVRLVRVLQACSDDVMVVGRREGPFAADIRVLEDEVPGLGAIGGIITGLRAARHPRAWIVACDMPFVDASLLSYLARAIGGAYAAMPRSSIGGYEPLCALYSVRLLPTLEAMVSHGENAVQGIPRQADVRIVEETELVSAGVDPRRLFNMNTAADYEEALRLVSVLG
jgi:molybdopterin-guanine dinucleotide biosynthesis protein A